MNTSGQTFKRVDAASAVRDAYDSIGKVRGDANNDGSLNVGDVFYLINHLFANGPLPRTTVQGNANCDEAIAVGDVFFLINHLFAGGQLCN